MTSKEIQKRMKGVDIDIDTVIFYRRLPYEPKGYSDWHTWAEIQTIMGRTQELCECGHYYWPHLKFCFKCNMNK